MRLISWLNGRSISLFSRVGDESAAVRCEIRVERGGDEVLLGSGSGLGRVRARAILQAFAPRSRTWGKWRLMSLRMCKSIEFQIVWQNSLIISLKDVWPLRL